MNQRLLNVAQAMDEINVRYNYLAENDIIWKGATADYCLLMDKNRTYIEAIHRSLGNTNPQLKSKKTSDLVLPSHDSNLNEKDELDLMMAIEVKLREICDLYEKIIDENPFATQEVIEFYMPFRIKHAQVIKSSKHIIYSYC